MDFWEITVSASSAGVDPVCGALMQAGISGFVIEDPEDFKRFLEEARPRWDYVDESLLPLGQGEAKVRIYVAAAGAASDVLADIEDIIHRLRQDPDAVLWGSLRLERSISNESDWENNWKQYYKPLRVGEHLVIVPSWEKYERQSGDVLISLDPGAAFGTGTHETTRLCLELIEKYVKPGDKMLDAGCGSGILSVAAALLGATVDARDVDIIAVDRTNENAHLNGISDRITATLSDLSAAADIDQMYDLIAANIVADVLIDISGILARCLNIGGILILSGIISDRRSEVCEHYTSLGLVELERREENEWTAAAFSK